MGEEGDYLTTERTLMIGSHLSQLLIRKNGSYAGARTL